VWVKSLGSEVTPVAQVAVEEGYSNTGALGELLYTKYLYPFELAAVILLLAIVAAIVLTMRQRTGLKQQDINAQVSVRAKDRVRVVKMESEKKS
jgi:NADH-quinone oxidoreductase subunit J